MVHMWCHPIISVCTLTRGVVSCSYEVTTWHNLLLVSKLYFGK